MNWNNVWFIHCIYEFVYILKGQKERSRWCVNINVGIIIIIIILSSFSLFSFLFLLTYTSYIPNYNLLRISNETTFFSLCFCSDDSLACNFSFFSSWFVSLSLQLSLSFVLTLSFAVFFFHSSSPKEWHLNEKREGKRIVLSFVLPIFFLFPLFLLIANAWIKFHSLCIKCWKW